MILPTHEIEIISAPSILGLKPTGVEDLGKSLLAAGLGVKLGSDYPVVHVPVLNSFYDNKREPVSNCLNAKTIRNFSVNLGQVVLNCLKRQHLAFVLGGDCSVLIGIMSGLKSAGNYGIIFLDAHADFYEPEKSITGEVADMDLAIITGRGPEILTNIHEGNPYVQDAHTIHIGQRDWEETRKYGSQDIRKTSIKCFDLAYIEKHGMTATANDVLHHAAQLHTDGFWIHFDTDVLSDEINPAVDYRLPGGLQFEQFEHLVRSLLLSLRVIGISVTIFNPALDKDGHIATNITDSLARAFNPGSSI